MTNLDAVKIKTMNKFDCIYSNKVLHNLSKLDLNESIQNQARVLNKDGIILHTFWRGDKVEEVYGMKFVYYTEDQLRLIFEEYFTIIELFPYEEISENDSIRIIARKI